MAPAGERDEERIALETKLMFLESTLEGLSDVVLAQGRELERLTRRVEELLAASETRERGEKRELADDVPPHY